MLGYIRDVQRGFVEQHGWPRRTDVPAGIVIPLSVPDGLYPMQIRGKTDYVRVTNGKISCCNFEGAE